MNEENSVLIVNGLCKTFGKTTKVLKEVSLKIEKGDVVAVLGPSGSGKTTLLRCLNFLEKAEQGKISYGHGIIDIAHITKAQIHAIRKKTGFVFQSYNLFRNKTALENVTLGLTLGQRLNRARARETGMEMLKRVGMEQYAASYPYQLSGGQQQRVAIARAIATTPDIIFFDEPTSALDPELIGEVLSVIKKLAGEGMTMLIVTHEMSFARDVANRVIFMENGSVLKDCPSKEFFTDMSDARVKSFLSRLEQ